VEVKYAPVFVLVAIDTTVGRIVGNLGLLEQAFHERPPLAKFDRVDHEYVAEGVPRSGQGRHRAQLGPPRACRLAWGPTREAGGQLGVLKRKLQKKRRHLPIRQPLKSESHGEEYH